MADLTNAEIHARIKELEVVQDANFALWKKYKFHNQGDDHDEIQNKLVSMINGLKNQLRNPA